MHGEYVRKAFRTDEYRKERITFSPRKGALADAGMSTLNMSLCSGKIPFIDIMKDDMAQGLTPWPVCIRYPTVHLNIPVLIAEIRTAHPYGTWEAADILIYKKDGGREYITCHYCRE